MSKISDRITFKKRPKGHVVENPGSLKVAREALKPVIKVYSYDSKEYFENDCKTVKSIDKLLESEKHLTHWIDVRGLGDLELLKYLEEKFNIHKLVLEDIINTYQRPKLDEYDTYLFATSRMVYMSRNNEIINEQVSFILLDKLLISFQEQYDDCIGEVVSRLKNKKGIIRSAGSSFMMYTIMDVIIDNYFGLLYKMGDDLDTIEELLYRKNDNRNIMIRTQDIKRVMITIRRAAWPERDKINDILRSESVLIAPETKTFYKDVYDHCMQVVDLVESYKDVTTTLVDTNLSFQSNRMNEIMKFLTIISSIFIPLTFIAGVYGMNFSYTDPGSGKILHNNMPELYEENGYLYSLYGMAIIAIVQIIYFWRRGWFR